MTYVKSWYAKSSLNLRNQKQNLESTRKCPESGKSMTKNPKIEKVCGSFPKVEIV